MKGERPPRELRKEAEEWNASMLEISWAACCLWTVHVSLEPQCSKIFRRAPFMERAKGPFMRGQPLGRRTNWEANSVSAALK